MKDKPATLSWQISSADPNLKIILHERVAHFSAPDWVGTTEVHFKVADPDGASDSMTVQIIVTLPLFVQYLASSIPKAYILAQNYPNPFNPGTTVPFGLPEPAQVSLRIYNLAGQMVAEIVNAKLPAGLHQFTWEAPNQAAGVYLIRLQADHFTQVRKCILLK